MKVLYVGEGRHDIGPDPVSPFHPRAAAGPIPILVGKIQPAISNDSLAHAWREIPRFEPSAEKRGFPAKVAGAVLLAGKFGCSGRILVADQDREPDRRSRLEDAALNAQRKDRSFAIVVGIAVESVEAWTLGVPQTIAAVLGVEEKQVRELYPGAPIEELSERSGKKEHQPKRLLEKIAELNHEEDCLDFRIRIAEQTEISELEAACPRGFAPFAQAIRDQFAA